jgi:hypothetical protein
VTLTLRKSAFMEQWHSYALDYHNRASISIAERFIGAVEAALSFIRQSPYACPVYNT